MNARVVQTESDFDAKPQVMLLGQYSTGKTTFIKHLLRTSYPGAHIGPEPTTDRFVVVMVGASSYRNLRKYLSLKSIQFLVTIPEFILYKILYMKIMATCVTL